MNIVIATFGYFPYSYGGTENYVCDQVNEFKNNHHNVTIISTLDNLPKDINHFYEDDFIIGFKYIYEGVDVIGIYLKYTDTSQLYDLDNNYLYTSYQNIVDEVNLRDIHVLQFNCFTSLINLNLYNAIYEYNRNVKLIFCVHTAFFCMKGTLINSNDHKLCKVNINVNDCFNCFYYEIEKESFLNSLLLNFSKTQVANKILPLNKNKYKLIDKFITSVKKMNETVVQFVVYSELYKNALINIGVPSNRILINRHGISKDFELLIPKQMSEKTIFIYSGRLMKLKGVETLIKAWSLLNESENRLLYLIFPGYSNSDINTELYMDFIQRKDVVVIESPSKIDLINYYHKAHCVIIPSEAIEIGPLVFHEAISAGCNIITSSNNGSIELAKYYNNDEAINIYDMKDEQQLKMTIEAFRYSKFNLNDKVISIEGHFKNLINHYAFE